MVAITKPADINKIWSSGGDIIAPSDTKIASGWSAEIPPRQYFNYIDNKQDQAIAHINQYGICVWDSTTEYQATKSYVQGPTDGAIYRCVSTHTNQNPETDATDTYWAIAFASAGEFYTKTEADAKYLVKANDLSDLTNTATARTNLSVYSQAQTYTKTEVDGKTTVASALQAQEQTSNTVLLSALRLADAFKGANQSLTTDGYQVLPGGLVVKWGKTALIGGNNTDHAYTFPTAYPNSCLAVLVSTIAPASPGVGPQRMAQLIDGSVTATGFSWHSDTLESTSEAAIGISYIAIGF